MTKKKRLSSILTFPYKYILPFIPIGLAIAVNLTINKEANQGYFIPVNTFFLIFFLIAYIPIRDIKRVEYDRNNLLSSNFFKTEQYRLKDVKQIKRWFFFFYKITIQMGNEIKTIKFLSPADERMLSPFRKLNSILEFEKRIENNK